MKRLFLTVACAALITACGSAATPAPPTATAAVLGVTAASPTALPAATTAPAPAAAIPTSAPAAAATAADIVPTAFAAATSTPVPTNTAPALAGTATPLPPPTATPAAATATSVAATATPTTAAAAPTATVSLLGLPTAAPGGAVILGSASQLLDPPDGETVERGTLLTWQAGRPLADDEYFVLQITFTHGQETWYDGGWLKETSWTIPNYFGPPHATSGWYEWKVVVMRQTGVGADGKPVGDAAGDESRPRRFLVTVPGMAPGEAAPPTPTPCGCY